MLAVRSCGVAAAAELPPLERAEEVRWSCPEVVRAGRYVVDGGGGADAGAVDGAEGAGLKVLNTGGNSRRAT